MADVLLPTAVFEDDPDQLPRVCALSGQSADRTVRFRLKSTPPGAYLLLFAGIVPFLAVQALTEQAVVVRLPVQQERLALVLRLRRAGGWLVLLGMGFVGLSFLRDVPALGWAGVAVFLMGLVGWVGANISLPWGRQAGPDHVEIHGVHEDFAAAIHSVTG